MAKVFFWIGLFGAIYSYFLYPIILTLLPSRRVRNETTASLSGCSVTLIITAHNEEGRIEEKLKNSLEIDFPSLEIIVASDASTDKTDEIVASYEKNNVKLVRPDKRLGKEYAQLQAIKAASGDILVFSDVATRIPSGALHKLVAYFDDEMVGAVSSEDRFMSRDGNVAGEGAYVKYEMWLRAVESQKAGLVGLSGSFFAARKIVCEDAWDICAPSDFNSALNCATKNMVAVTAPDVLGFYQDVKDASKEYQRKLRTIIRGLTAITRHPEVLNPFSYGAFSFQVWSHKVMRWLVPWFLVMLFLSNLSVLNQGGIYSLVFAAQLFFYLVVGMAYCSAGLREKTLFKIPLFFVQVNLAIAHATVQFVSGKRMTVWNPSER